MKTGIYAYEHLLKLSTLGSCTKVCASIVQFSEVFLLVFLSVSLVLLHTLLLLALCSSWQPFRVASSAIGLSTASMEMQHTGCGGKETIVHLKKITEKRFEMKWGRVNNDRFIRTIHLISFVYLKLHFCACWGTYLAVWERFCEGAVCEIWSVRVWRWI